MNRKIRRPWHFLLAILIINITILAAVVATLNSASAHTAPSSSPQQLKNSESAVESEFLIIVEVFGHVPRRMGDG